MVRRMGLEPTRANAHYPLKVACLPFHHLRKTNPPRVIIKLFFLWRKPVPKESEGTQTTYDCYIIAKKNMLVKYFFVKF